LAYQWLYYEWDLWGNEEISWQFLIEQHGARRNVYMLVAQQENWYMKGKYSKYSKIIRTMMWILCFINNCQALRSTESTELIIKKNTVLEFMVLKWTLSQQESFNGVNEPRLSTLKVYEDENGLLRLKSSVINREDTHDFYCSIIVDPKHSLTKKLIE